jgi:arabinogalactan endo-1,4-beta-galactosidase
VLKCVVICAVVIAIGSVAPAEEPGKVIAGADISMLPEIEKAGGVYRNADGMPGDAIAILHQHGCTLFRVRLFVDPGTDFNGTYGATQNLPYVRALAKRIAAAGGKLLLDIHYSDTWADPGKQFKPAAWKDLPFDALVQKVHDYTADVLKTLADDGVHPEMVQVGNEITAGMLWPDGKLLNTPPDKEDQQWRNFSTLFNAGAKAVRETQTPDHPIRIVLHIHGGGKQGMAKWFFEKLNRNPVDYDIVGLSFYPAWDDSMDALKQNLADAIHICNKDVLIAETSYPWHQLPDKSGPTMAWPQTKEGQTQFVKDLTALLAAAPGHHAIGFVWWYPEAIPAGSLQIWRSGYEALFGQTGEALPAMDAFNTAK